MPGRSRTGWRPFRMEMSLAPYATRAIPSCKPVVGVPEDPVLNHKSPGQRAEYRVLSVPETGGSPGPWWTGNHDSHRPHRARAATLVHACNEVARGVPKLGRPSRSVDDDRALAVMHGSHARVRRDHGPCYLRPSGRDRRNDVGRRYPQLFSDARDRVAQRYRIVATRHARAVIAAPGRRARRAPRTCVARRRRPEVGPPSSGGSGRPEDSARAPRPVARPAH